jgi:hypothetical protein
MGDIGRVQKYETNIPLSGSTSSVNKMFIVMANFIFYSFYYKKYSKKNEAFYATFSSACCDVRHSSQYNNTGEYGVSLALIGLKFRYISLYSPHGEYT